MADGTQSKCRAVCLISGSGTNLQAIIENINNKSLNIDLISVISDNPMAKGIQRAEKEGIDTKIIDYSTFEDRKDFEIIDEYVQTLRDNKEFSQNFSRIKYVGHQKVNIRGQNIIRFEVIASIKKGRKKVYS